MTALFAAAALLLTVAVPLFALLEGMRGSETLWLRLRLFLSLGGAAFVMLISVVFSVKVQGVGDAAREWAMEFYFGHLWQTLPVLLLLCAVISAAFATEHRMRRVAMILSVLIPFTAAAYTLFISVMAGDGVFAVDTYIAALAPPYAALSHLPFLFRRRGRTEITK